MGHTEFNEAAIAVRVQAEQLRVFRDRWMRGAQTSPLGLLFIGWVIHLSAGWQRAATWTGLMVIIELSVFWIGQRHRQAEAAHADARRWMRALLATCVVAGLGWGSSVWFGWSQSHFMLYVINLCVLVGIAGISTMIAAPHPYANALFSVGLMLPLLAHITWVNSIVALQIMSGWAVMSVVHMLVAGDHRRELVRQLDATERNRQLVDLLMQARAEQQRSAERLKNLVNVDQLTGAFTRRYIFEHLERQVANLKRHGTPASIIMLDLDHFKMVNDQYGHPVGDRALIAVALAVTGQLREGDLLARVGGEEFLVLLPMTSQSDALLMAERLRAMLQQTAITEGDEIITLPASFGVAELRPDEDISNWYRRADVAMYQAKRRGRNSLFGAL